MRVGFAGTPEFAARALAAIVHEGYTIPLVLTQPDRPKGRGLAAAPSAVKQWAQAQGLALMQPASLKGENESAALVRIPLDVLVVAAYGLLLPAAILAWPRHGCVNIHASLLPRWRGAAPIERAIEAGDRTTGISIMQMDAGLDTGAVIHVREVAIGPRETSGSLRDTLASAGAAAIVDVLRRLAGDGKLASVPQPAEGVTYAAKVTRGDAAIDWRSPAAALDRKIRAFDPKPGAFAKWRDQPVKIWRAEPIVRSTEASPGEVMSVGAEGIDVACGSSRAEGSLRIVEMQSAGTKRMPAHAFAAGHRVAVGTHFAPGQG